MEYTPYINWTLTDFNAHLKNLANKLRLSIPIKVLMEEALLDSRWDPVVHYDGCTLVQDMYHPCLSCFVHDYLWKTGQGGRDADKVFLWLMIKEGMPEKKAKRRYWGVRLYWLFWAKWKHIGMRNVNPYIPAFKEVLIHIKKDKI